jgi:hypothetical protein
MVMVQSKQLLAPAILFAAGSFAGVANATVFVDNVDITAIGNGTMIAIGVPLSSAQFTFKPWSEDFGPYGVKSGAELSADSSTTNGAFFWGADANYIPDGSYSFNNSLKTGGSFGSGDGYYGLRFGVGDDTVYGYALLDQGGYHISQIAYDTPSHLEIKTGEVGGAVPEVSTWAEMILGMGAAGAMLRRRRRQMASAATA